MAQEDFNIMEPQIIVPVKNNGAACTYELNNSVQELYNPADKRKKEHNGFSNGKPYILREGDKVMNVVNNYKTEPPIYNGNIGVIRSIYANMQNLIDGWRKRLCGVATEEAVALAQDFKVELHKTHPLESDVLVQNCIYRAGCPEFSCCGHIADFMKWAKEHNKEIPWLNIQARYDLYNEFFYHSTNGMEAGES